MGTKLNQLIVATYFMSCRLAGAEDFEAVAKRANPVESCCLLNKVITSIFSISNQTILSGGTVIFEHENVGSEPIDVTMAPHSGTILFNQTGVYEICWHLAGIFNSDAMSPWSFGLSIEDEIIPHSIFERACHDEKVCHAGVTLIHLITAGQKLSLVNMSQNSVQLISSSYESSRPVISAMLNIKMLSRLD